MKKDAMVKLTVQRRTLKSIEKNLLLILSRAKFQELEDFYRPAQKAMEGLRRLAKKV